MHPDPQLQLAVSERRLGVVVSSIASESRGSAPRVAGTGELVHFGIDVGPASPLPPGACCNEFVRMNGETATAGIWHASAEAAPAGAVAW